MSKLLENDLRTLNKRLEFYENQVADSGGNADDFTMRQINYYQKETSKVRDVLLDSFSIDDTTPEAPLSAPTPNLTGAETASVRSNEAGY